MKLLSALCAMLCLSGILFGVANPNKVQVSDVTQPYTGTCPKQCSVYVVMSNPRMTFPPVYSDAAHKAKMGNPFIVTGTFTFYVGKPGTYWVKTVEGQQPPSKPIFH